MDPTTNPTPNPSSAVDSVNVNGVSTDELTRLPPNSVHGGEMDDGVDFSKEGGSESNEAIDTENGSRSVEKNQYSETVDVVTTKDQQKESDSQEDEVEIVIKNQHEYYFYCPCCGEDITKTVKLVKKSDLQPKEKPETKNDSRTKDKKTKAPSWFPVYLQQLLSSVDGYFKDKVPGKEGVDSKSPGTFIDLGINGEEPNIDINNEKDGKSFPKWYLDAFAWLFLCIIIALSVLYTSPPPFIQPELHSPSVSSLGLPSVSSLGLPSASILLLLPTFAVLLLVIMAISSRYSPSYHRERGDKKIDSKSHDNSSKEQIPNTQNHDDQAADPDQDSDKKTGNQKVHPAPLDPSPQEQPSTEIVNKETHENAESDTPAKTQAGPELLPNTQPEIPNSVEPRKGGNKLEILKSIVYGGLTESITSLCTVTSAAASGASTLNIFALGIANLSSGLLLIVHSLQELINEKPRRQINTDDQTNSEEKEEDPYEETLGRRERFRLHSSIAVLSFVIIGIIPPLVYGFSFRRRIERRKEYKVLSVYAVSLVCVVLLSIAKAYVSKKREYLKTMFRYTTMAMTASGCSQFVGYLVSTWLEKSGFYDETPRV